MKIFLQKQTITEKLYLEAKNYFNEKYLKELGEKANLKESLASRFLISKLFEENFGLKYFEPKIDKFGKPIFENGLFWSISHKNGLVFVGVSDCKIGLDIEILKERDENLLNTFSLENYNLLGGKSLENFYILWTIKESLIKYKLLYFDEFKSFKLLGINNKVHKFGEVIFTLEIEVIYNGVVYIVYSGKKWYEIFSLVIYKK